jgi:hypothetical protein
LIRPTLDHAIAFNRSERREDEWFDEPDDLDRVQRALDSIAGCSTTTARTDCATCQLTIESSPTCSSLLPVVGTSSRSS